MSRLDPDTPSSPLSSSTKRSSPSASRPRARMRCTSAPGSTSPERLLIISPPIGVSPIVVSWARPFSTAARLRSAAQVRDHGTGAEPRAQRRHGPLVGEPVEPEPPHTRHGQRLGDEGKVVMEAGVEARDLRDARPGPPASFDPGQRGGLVPRARRHQQPRCPRAPSSSIMCRLPPRRAAVHDAMTDRVGRGQPLQPRDALAVQVLFILRQQLFAAGFTAERGELQ